MLDLNRKCDEADCKYQEFVQRSTLKESAKNKLVPNNKYCVHQARKQGKGDIHSGMFGACMQCCWRRDGGWRRGRARRRPRKFMAKRRNHGKQKGDFMLWTLTPFGIGSRLESHLFVFVRGRFCVSTEGEELEVGVG